MTSPEYEVAMKNLSRAYDDLALMVPAVAVALDAVSEASDDD